MQGYSKLSDHKFIKGKFITPFNTLMSEVGREDSWFHGRLPEYIWLALILNYYGRDEGLLRCRFVLEELRKQMPNLYSPKLSSIFAIDDAKQKKIYSCFKKHIQAEVLSPLTAIFTYTHHSNFSCGFLTNMSLEERMNKINDVIVETSHHQSELSTDTRFLIVFFRILSRKLYMPQDTLDLILEYPTMKHDNEKMRMIRPLVRAMEIAPDEEDPYSEPYLTEFWDGVSRMSECKLFFLDIPEDSPEANEYIANVKERLEYYTNLLQVARPLDIKMLVLTGIATYSYKRMLEVCEYRLYNTIAGRSVVRVLVDCLITMKYLLKHECEHANIWTEYQYYGIGQYKLVVERYKETGTTLPSSHVMYDYMDLLVSEYKNKEFIDMDTSYFGKMNIREKAIDVGEKELFGLFYDYDSAFEHGLWGAIRESSLIKCDSPLHQYHCIPDIENKQRLKSVWFDCVNCMNRILVLLKDIYGLPDHM